MNWKVLQPYLPQAWLAALGRLSAQESAGVQEIRLRADEPIVLSFADGDRILGSCGVLSLRQRGALLCQREELQTCFMRFCEDSVYAHEAELRQGFIAVRGGIRVGVAGTAVIEGDAVRSLRQVTSLCVRLPRRHSGSSASLMPLVYRAGAVCSTLLVGEPSSGKTTLLRDMAVSLAARGVRVTVVDERGEIGGLEGLRGCDVLRGYPKAVGMLQAVRCLAPQVVLFDELGTADEVTAVTACAHAGVATVASLHGRAPHELMRKSALRRLAQADVFRQWVFLQGRDAPGQWHDCLYPEVIKDAIYWRVVDCGGGAGIRDCVCPPTTTAGGLLVPCGTAVGGTL